MKKTEYIDPEKVKFLNEYQKAQEVGCSVSYLRKDRLKDEPVFPYIKFGRMVRYPYANA